MQKSEFKMKDEEAGMAAGRVVSLGHGSRMAGQRNVPTRLLPHCGIRRGKPRRRARRSSPYLRSQTARYTLQKAPNPS